MELAKETFERRTNLNEPGVTELGCDAEQHALDKTLEGYVRYQLEAILKRCPCPANTRERMAAEMYP